MIETKMSKLMVTRRPRRPGAMQARVLQLLPRTKAEVARHLNVKHGFFPSSTYRAISTLLARGVILMGDDGILRNHDDTSPTS